MKLNSDRALMNSPIIIQSLKRRTCKKISTYKLFSWDNQSRDLLSLFNEPNVCVLSKNKRQNLKTKKLILLLRVHISKTANFSKETLKMGRRIYFKPAMGSTSSNFIGLFRLTLTGG